MCRNRSFNGSGAATPKSSYGGGATPRSKMRSTGNFTLEDASKNFQVVVRVRPPLARELHGDRPFQCCVKVESERSITIGENLDAEAGIGPYQRSGSHNHFAPSSTAVPHSPGPVQAEGGDLISYVSQVHSVSAP